MALRTNSKQARENIRRYIIEHYDGSGYDEDTPQAKATTFEEIAAVIRDDVLRVEDHNFKRYRYYSYEKAFCEWAAGLPNLLDTCYYYNRSAVDDLGLILEESEQEKAKYSESEAEEMLSWLLCSEIFRR